MRPRSTGRRETQHQQTHTAHREHVHKDFSSCKHCFLCHDDENGNTQRTKIWKIRQKTLEDRLLAKRNSRSILQKKFFLFSFSSRQSFHLHCLCVLFTTCILSLSTWRSRRTREDNRSPRLTTQDRLSVAPHGPRNYPTAPSTTQWRTVSRWPSRLCLCTSYFLNMRLVRGTAMGFCSSTTSDSMTEKSTFIPKRERCWEDEASLPRYKQTRKTHTSHAISNAFCPPSLVPLVTFFLRSSYPGHLGFLRALILRNTLGHHKTSSGSPSTSLFTTWCRGYTKLRRNRLSQNIMRTWRI